MRRLIAAIVAPIFCLSSAFPATGMAAGVPVVAQGGAEGLIRYSRGNLEVIDRAGLERRACECYRVIRAEFDNLPSA